MTQGARNLDDCCLGIDHSIRDAIARINQTMLGIVLVVDDERRLINTITDGDVRRALLANADLDAPLSVLIEQKKRGPLPQPVTAAQGTKDADLLHMMNEERLQQIPILDDEGRVADLALLRDLAQDYEADLKAVIMAGGFGTRLRPLTEELPKPMLPVGDRPLLQRTIEQLRDSGINHVNITTHFLPEKITEHFGSGDAWGINLNYVNEEEPLGTAGSLALIENTGETLLVMNGDILTNVDFRAMHNFHRANRADLTVAVRKYDVEVPYGVVDCDGPQVTGIVEKPVMSFFVNAGIYLVEPSAHAEIPTNEYFDMTDLIRRLVNAGRTVISFPISEFWLDVGQHDDYRQAQNFAAGEQDAKAE